MKNRNIKNILISSMSAAFLIFVSSCAGFNKTHPQEGSYLVSGKISLSAESGAMPSQLQNLLNTSARTATSTFAQTTNEIARDFTVTATHTIAETGEVITKTCVIETSEDGSRTYSLRLPYTGEWTLEARLFGYIDDDPATTEDESTTDSIAYLDGQATINITEEASSLIKNIIVSPVFNSNTQGKVNLPVIDETGSVSLIKIFEYETDLDGKEVMAATPSLDTTFINSPDYIQGDYEPGSHKIAIYFYNSESETQEIYSCTEVFVVYSGFVTDIWYGQAPHLRYNDETRQYEFVITDELLRDYVKRGDLTTKKDEDGYLDTPYILWSCTTDERVSSSDSTQVIEFEGGTSYETGVQVVGSLNEETTIYRPFSSSGNTPCFCFGDDGYLYVLESGSIYNSVINCYKESYSGYISAQKIDLEEKYFSDYGSHTFGSALLYKDGYLFFIFSNRDSNYNLTYNLCILDLASETLYAEAVIPSLESVSGSLNSSAGIAVKWENADDESNPNLIKKGVLYYSTSNSNEYIENEIISQPFTISLNSDNNSYELQMDSTTAFSYSLSKENLGVESVAYRFLVSDMQIQDDILYVLINAYTNQVSTLYKKIDDDNYSEHTIYTSNGGVLRFELSDSNSTSTSAFVPSLWGDEEDSPLVLGLYTDNEMYYKYSSSNGYTASNLDGDDLRPFVTTPPLSEAESYFYGPQKFIAIKPKELVIADDGAYFDESKIYCKNRVVKVNLGEEALGQMNVTDVNVTFTKKLGSCGGIILN